MSNFFNYPRKVTRTERGNAHGGATKARALFTQLLTQKSTPLSSYRVITKWRDSAAFPGNTFSSNAVECWRNLGMQLSINL